MIYPQQTAIPARVIVEGVGLTDASVRLIENRYMGEITTFYWRQKQKHQLSGLDVYVGREEIGDLKFTFIHLHGTDALKVRVPEGLGEEPVGSVFLIYVLYDPSEHGTNMRLEQEPTNLPGVFTVVQATRHSGTREPVGTQASIALYNITTNFVAHPGLLTATTSVPGQRGQWAGYLVDTRRLKQNGAEAAEYSLRLRPAGTVRPSAEIASDTYITRFSVVWQLSRNAYDVYDHTGTVIESVGAVTYTGVFGGNWDAVYEGYGGGYHSVGGDQGRADEMPQPPSWVNFSGPTIIDTQAVGNEYPFWAVPYNGTNAPDVATASAAFGAIIAKYTGTVTPDHESFYDFGPPPFSVPINSPPSPYPYHSLGAGETMSPASTSETVLENRWSIFQRPPMPYTIAVEDLGPIDLSQLWERLDDIVAREDSDELTYPDSVYERAELHQAFLEVIGPTSGSRIFSNSYSQTHAWTFQPGPFQILPQYSQPAPFIRPQFLLDVAGGGMNVTEETQVI